ncbi:MAG: gamma-glutamyl-gamma-aminobutyrate hydrolase family protein [Vicinamibacterales bacterium]
MPRIAIAFPQPDYIRSLEQAGATPRVLDPAVDVLPQALDDCDGILLTGGADIAPARYGTADLHPTTRVDSARDEYEFVLVREALAREMPLLAICRGVQLLNVAAGGTLVQDLASQRPGSVRHVQRDPPTSTPHVVQMQEGSILATLATAAGAQTTALAVNSRHHQGIDQLAPGFKASAAAADGLVEAIERPNVPFCMGVQWHPENFWQTGEFSWVFEGLVAAARRWRVNREQIRDAR